MLTLALDIGGTKIAVGLTDPAGELVHKAVEPTPKDQEAEHVWSLVDRMIADATKVAQGAIQRGRHWLCGPDRRECGNRQPGQYRLVARLSAARPDRGSDARRAGAAGRRRHLHGPCRALAWCRSRCQFPARHGGLDRCGRRAGARRGAVSRAHRQRRSCRPRRRRARRAAVPLRRPRLRRDRGVRTVDDAVGAGQRLGGATRRRRRDAGRSGRRR